MEALEKITMTAKQFDALLVRLHACDDARTWATGKTLQAVWETCERGDWLLWLAGRMEGKPGWHTRQQIVLAACACAETALKYVPAGEDRPRLAIEVARRWAAYAAYGAADAVAADAADAYAAYAAADAVAAYAVRTRSLKELADIVRRELPQPGQANEQ